MHFEIPVDDMDHAFYGTCSGGRFGRWRTSATRSSTRHRTDEQTQALTKPGAINGGMMRRSAEAPVPSVTLQVESIDDALKRIEAGGGSTVRPRTELPGMGAHAYFKDPEGNVGGLWENL